MRRLETEALFSEVEDWRCARCGEAQVVLGGFAPPASRLCEGCGAPPPQTLGAALRRAGVPRTFVIHALEGRQGWLDHFRKKWPAGLKGYRLAELEMGLPPIAYLWGDTGTGKTSAAVILLAEALSVRPSSAVFVDGLQMIADVQREIGDPGSSGLIENLISQQALVIDEPLSGRPTPWAFQQILRLLRAREAEGRPTIITSQLDPADLMTQRDEGGRLLVPPALVSRALSGLRVYFPGEDVRLRQEVD